MLTLNPTRFGRVFLHVFSVFAKSVNFNRATNEKLKEKHNKITLKSPFILSGIGHNEVTVDTSYVVTRTTDMTGPRPSQVGILRNPNLTQSWSNSVIIPVIPAVTTST